MIFLVLLFAGIASCSGISSLTPGLSTDVCYDGRRTNCVPCLFPFSRLMNGTLYFGSDSVKFFRLRLNPASSVTGFNLNHQKFLRYVRNLHHVTLDKSIPVSCLIPNIFHYQYQDYIFNDSELSPYFGINSDQLVNSNTNSGSF